MKTFDIHEAADFLKIDRKTAMELAATGDLPGAKVGRAWVFLETDLVDYLRDKVRRQTNERREQQRIEKRAPTRPDPSSVLPVRGRRRSLPSLPEVSGEVTPAKVGVTS